MQKETLEFLEDINERELVSLLRELIRIPSPTGGENAISHYLTNYAKIHQFTSIHLSDKWDVVVRVDGEIKGPRILFLTHTDHSEPARTEEAYSPRISFRKDSGKCIRIVTGKGSNSPKGSLAAMLYAGKTLARRKKDLKGSLIIAAVSRDLLANHDGVREVAEKRWIDADMAIIGEPSENRPIIGARGVNHISITIQGNPTHRGTPGKGINPIWTIEQVLGKVKKLIEDLPSHPSLGKATLTPIDIKCEVFPPQTPSSSCLVLDRRSLPGEDAGKIIKALRQKLDSLKSKNKKICVESIRQMYPFEGNTKCFISKKVKEINDAINGSRLPYGYLPFSTDGGFLARKMKIPCVIYGPGRFKDVFVSNEHAELEKVSLAARVYAATAYEVLYRKK